MTFRKNEIDVVSRGFPWASYLKVVSAQFDDGDRRERQCGAGG